MCKGTQTFVTNFTNFDFLPGLYIDSLYTKLIHKTKTIVRFDALYAIISSTELRSPFEVV